MKRREAKHSLKTKRGVIAKHGLKEKRTAGWSADRKRTIGLFIINMALLILTAIGIERYRILYAPQDLFTQSTLNPVLLVAQNATPPPAPEPEETGVTGNPGASASQSSGPAIEPTITPTVEPTPDITENKDILNILLIGVDRRPDANSGAGKGTPASEGTQPHSDVMMVIAINFKEKRVDLISLPRDTFVHDPELGNGVYKLNSYFNVGGGFAAKDGAGFRKVCKAAQYMLGGIPVDYYYAVDFDSLVKLVDAIGGVNFNVDSRSYSRQRKAGMQHMSGADVLYFMRVRKAGPETGDLNRINRQKEMLIAIFNQLRQKGKLSMVPDLIATANSGVFTNLNLEQTLALANFAKTVEPKNIGTHSMSGTMAYTIYWRWCFTDQANRVKLIRQIYGINVPKQVRCSERYAQWLANYGFSGMVYQKAAKRLLDYAEQRKANFTEKQHKAYDSLTACYAETKKAWDLASQTFKSSDNRRLSDDKKKLRTSSEALARLLGYTKLKWNYAYSHWWREPAINEVPVDFN